MSFPDTTKLPYECFMVMTDFFSFFVCITRGPRAHLVAITNGKVDFLTSMLILTTGEDSEFANVAMFDVDL